MTGPSILIAFVGGNFYRLTLKHEHARSLKEPSDLVTFNGLPFLTCRNHKFEDLAVRSQLVKDEEG